MLGDYLGFILLFQVMPGDYLGFIGETGQLDSYDANEVTTSYSTSSTGLTWPESSVDDSNHEFYLSAHLATFSKMHVSSNYTTALLLLECLECLECLFVC